MLITDNYDPNCISIIQIEILTNKGLVTIGEGESISYIQDQNGDLYIGSSGTVLRVRHKTALQDLSKVIKPASFSLVAEEDGEISLKASILDNAPSPYIPEVTDRKFKDVADIISIRGHEGALI
jgi:hypothetical protein